MRRYIGMDVHAASCTLAVISEKGRKLKGFPVETNGQALVEAIRMIPGHKYLVMEEWLQSATLVADVVRGQARIKSLYRSRGIFVTGVNVYGVRHCEQ